MKVICLYRKLTKELIKEFGLDSKAYEFEFDLEVGKEYTVLSISQSCDDNYNESRTGKYPKIGVDNGYGLHFVPLYMFKIIDNKASKYWHVEFNYKTKWLSMEPELFREEFFYDDYTNDFPNIVEKYESTLSLLENEF